MLKKINKKEKSEFEQKLVDIARVVRIVAGGRRFRFRATVVIGNRKGKVGVGIGKAANVTSAVSKAVAFAKKNLILVPIVDGTIPHEVTVDYGGAKVFLKPARPGTGVIAGGPVRAVVELAGIKNILSKMQGSANKLNNVQATILALKNLRTTKNIEKERGKKILKSKQK
jgi:small subunit ribosomal protein S5